MQQRYYDPAIGRFLSVDPVGPLADPSNHFGRYHYAYNNPYRFTDPDGRAPGSRIGCGGESKGPCDPERQSRAPADFRSNASEDPTIAEYRAERAGKLGTVREAAQTASEIGDGLETIYFTAISGLGGGIAGGLRGGLGSLGRAGTGKGIREVVGDAADARRLFDQLRGSNPITEVKPGVFTASGTNGGTVTFRATSQSGPPTVDVHGIEDGIRKIKFVEQ